MGQYIAQRAWVTRRERYGSSGYTPDGLAGMVERTRRRFRLHGHHHANKTHCKRGHAFTRENTRVYHGRRYCRACERLRHAGRPAWCVAAGVRISILAHDRFYRKETARLRRSMCDAHPDRGGTAQLFTAARKRLQAFLENERAWYAVLELKPPRLTESKQSVAKRGWATRRRGKAAA